MQSSSLETHVAETPPYCVLTTGNKFTGHMFWSATLVLRRGSYGSPDSYVAHNTCAADSRSTFLIVLMILSRKATGNMKRFNTSKH